MNFKLRPSPVGLGFEEVALRLPDSMWDRPVAARPGAPGGSVEPVVSGASASAIEPKLTKSETAARA